MLWFEFSEVFTIFSATFEFYWFISILLLLIPVLVGIPILVILLAIDFIKEKRPQSMVFLCIILIYGLTWFNSSLGIGLLGEKAYSIIAEVLIKQNSKSQIEEKFNIRFYEFKNVENSFSIIMPGRYQ